MKPLELKSKLQSGGKVYGTMIWALEGTRWHTSFSRSNLDFVVIEAEHAPRDRSQIAELSQMFKNLDITTIVRVTTPDPVLVGMVIDAGADGVLVPYTEKIEDVKRCSARAYNNPLKGTFLERAMNDQKYPSAKSQAYLNERNRERIFILGIESQPALENLDELVSCAPMDGVFVGPNDLTTSMGIPDELDNNIYINALKRIISISENHNIPVMIHHATIELSLLSIKLGSRFILHGSDSSLLTNSINHDFSTLRDENSPITKKKKKNATEKPY